jgi:hypothetical protein
VFGTGEDVYVVVGYQTMVDVTVLRDIVKSEKTSRPDSSYQYLGQRRQQVL